MRLIPRCLVKLLSVIKCLSKAYTVMVVTLINKKVVNKRKKIYKIIRMSMFSVIWMEYFLVLGTFRKLPGGYSKNILRSNLKLGDLNW